jgi:membrane-associated phospholipid phosphatase
LPDAPRPQSVASSSAPASSFPADEAVTVRNSPRIFLHDEEGIWTSPARLRPHDLVWLAPFAVAAGAAIATDHRAQNQVISHDPGFNNANINTSNILVGGILAAPVALFAAGQFQQDNRARETGILGGEAIVDGLVVSEVSKLVSRRERPDVDQSRGRFFQSGVGADSSFFSMHTTVAFSAATVIASEYHSPWVQVAAYTGASAVGVTRLLGGEHFPSDVLIGATTGWLIGHYVVKHHHHAL